VRLDTYLIGAFHGSLRTMYEYVSLTPLLLLLYVPVLVILRIDYQIVTFAVNRASCQCKTMSPPIGRRDSQSCVLD